VAAAGIWANTCTDRYTDRHTDRETEGLTDVYDEGKRRSREWPNAPGKKLHQGTKLLMHTVATYDYNLTDIVFIYYSS